MKPLPGQLDLFAPRKGQEIQLNSSVPEHEAPRLSTQHQAILDALLSELARPIESEPTSEE